MPRPLLSSPMYMCIYVYMYICIYVDSLLVALILKVGSAELGFSEEVGSLWF